MTKLSETKCRRCGGEGVEGVIADTMHLPARPLTVYLVCPTCNGKGYEKETVSGAAPIASINHEGRD